MLTPVSRLSRADWDIQTRPGQSVMTAQKTSSDDAQTGALRAPKSGGRARRSDERGGRAISSLARSLKRGRQGQGSAGKGRVSFYASRGRGWAGSLAAVPARNLQRVVVKISYMGTKSMTQWGKHGLYLEREGAQRDGERGRGFGRDSDDVGLAQSAYRWQQAGDKRLWKIIISPERGDSIDLRAYTRDVMREIERDLAEGDPDFGIEWAAIDHHNTAAPHVHVIVRGVDSAGAELQISPNYVSHGVRRRAQELATERLGYRTERDRALAAEREISAERLTGIDRALMRKADEHGLIDMSPLASSEPDWRVKRRTQELRRLSKLGTMGLAKRVENHTWLIEPDNLREALKQVQLAGDRQKSLAQSREFLSDARLPLHASNLRRGQRLVGRLIGRGISDSTDRAYALVEGHDARVHYVSGRLADELMEDHISVGDVVSYMNVGKDSRPPVSWGAPAAAYANTQFLDRELNDGRLEALGENSTGIRRELRAALVERDRERTKAPKGKGRGRGKGR